MAGIAGSGVTGSGVLNEFMRYNINYRHGKINLIALPQPLPVTSFSCSKPEELTFVQ